MTQQQRTAYRLAETSSLAQAVNQFLLDCEVRNLIATTLRFYWQRLGLFVAYCDRAGVVTPEAINAGAFARLHRLLLGHSPYYQHQHARAVKTFCGFLVRDGILTISPMTAVRMPRLPKDLLPAFAPADVGALLAACGCDRDPALFLTTLDPGMRPAELLALDMGDVGLQISAHRLDDPVQARRDCPKYGGE